MGQINEFKKGHVIISFDKNFNPHDLYGGYWWTDTHNGLICGAETPEQIGRFVEGGAHSHEFRFSSDTGLGTVYATAENPSGPLMASGVFENIQHDIAEWTSSAGTQYTQIGTTPLMKGEGLFKTHESGESQYDVTRKFCTIWHKMD